MNLLTRLFDRVLLIHPEDNVPLGVAANFKHNVFTNTFDQMFFSFSDSIWSISTIIPVFAATLTDSPLLIGLIPAVVTAGSFIPQLFMSGRISKMPKVLPFVLKLAFLERMPLTFLPLLTLLIGNVANQNIYWLLLFLMIWRGIGGGMASLPWQELNARVIPISHWARFIGLSRIFAQLTGLLGSLLSVYLLRKFPYPQNYAIGFAVAAISTWFSYASISRNREPEPKPISESKQEDEPKAQQQTWSLMKQILKSDGNFRRYLVSRALAFLGDMASAFIALYAINRFNLEDAYAAIFTALLLLSRIFGYGFWGALGDRIGPQKVVISSFTTWGLGLVLAIFSQSLWVFYAVFVAFGFYTSGLALGYTMLVMELGDEKLRPTYLGMARTLTGGFLLLAPVLSGWLVQSFNYIVMFAVSFGFVVLSTIMMMTVKDRPRKRLA